MPTVIALACPVCGAPLRPGSETCGFCGSFIVIKTDLPKLERRTLNQAVIQEHIATFRKRVRADRYDEGAHYGLGIAYYNLGLIDYAVDELTNAARLMPENPHIHAQLAVALWELSDSEDTDDSDRLNHHLDLALRLDEDNIQALSLRAEMLAFEGDYDNVQEIVDRISAVDVRQGQQVLERLQINRIDQLLEENRWFLARSNLQTLAKTNQAAAKKLIVSYLEGERDYFPLLLIAPIDRDRIRTSVDRKAGLVFVTGMALGVLAAAAGAPAVLPAVTWILTFVAWFEVRRRLRIAASQEEVDIAIEIDDDSLDMEAMTLDDLLRKADALHNYQIGMLIDLNEV
jgi:tetratricopeptide (TPR) repeat protein